MPFARPSICPRSDILNLVEVGSERPFAAERTKVCNAREAVRKDHHISDYDIISLIESGIYNEVVCCMCGWISDSAAA